MKELFETLALLGGALAIIFCPEKDLAEYMMAYALVFAILSHGYKQ
jgi:hypothetical protein